MIRVIRLTMMQIALMSVVAVQVQGGEVQFDGLDPIVPSEPAATSVVDGQVIHAQFFPVSRADVARQERVVNMVLARNRQSIQRNLRRLTREHQFVQRINSIVSQVPVNQEQAEMLREIFITATQVLRQFQANSHRQLVNLQRQQANVERQVQVLAKFDNTHPNLPHYIERALQQRSEVQAIVNAPRPSLIPPFQLPFF